MFALVIKKPLAIVGHVSIDFKRWLFTKHFFLILAMVVYLLLESSFHAFLTMTVIDPSSDIDAIHRVEIYGRLISGFGSGLLFTGFFFNRLHLRFKTKLLKSLIFSAIFCAVFFGQKAFIETVLVEPSTPQVRRDALLVNTVKTGIFNADVISKALPINVGLREDIEPKVMVALTSAGFLYNEQFKQTTLRSIKPILTAIASNSYDQAFEQEILPNYVRSRNDINRAFNEYASAHRSRDLRLADSAVNEDYRNIYESAANDYVRQDIRKQAREAGYSLTTNREKREFERNVTASLNEIKKYHSTHGRSSLTVGSAKRFIQQASTRNSDINRSIETELNLPKGSFQLYPQTRAVPWIRHHIIENFEQELSNQLASEGIHNMRPNIRSFRVFESQKDIKEKATKLLGDYSVPGFSFNMSNSQLHKAMKPSFINVEVARLYNEITGDVNKFQDGAELAETGKDALRALLIPCIAIILSVLLSITSIVKLSIIGLNSIFDSFVRSCDTEKKLLTRDDMDMVNKPLTLHAKSVKIIRLLIVLAVVYVVVNAPQYIGWHEGVKPLLSENSLIRKNIVPFFDIITYSFAFIVFLAFFIFLPCSFVSTIWKTERLVRDKRKAKNHEQLGMFSIRKLYYPHAIAKFLIKLFAVTYIFLITMITEREQQNIAIYEWLLSVQPAVFHYGMILNDQLSLPHMVDSITPQLKRFDEKFWPAH